MRHLEDMTVKSRTSVLVSCVLTTLLAGTAAHGQAIGWGDDSQGQASVSGIGRMRKSASGFAHTLLLTGCGDVTAVGYNAAGQTSVPVGLPAIMDIAAGGFFSLALDSNNKIHVWGDASAGQFDVPTDLNATPTISAGYAHAVAAFECLGDLNGDAVVDLNDIAIVLGGWGGPNGDVNCDGVTNGTDYFMVLSSLGSCM